MKVLIVLNHYLPQHIAGTEVYSSLLADYLYKNNCIIKVVIPNYNSSVNYTYDYNGIEVIRYAEPSQVDRALITGKRKPDGLASFEKHLLEQNPDVVHFQELAGSNGITIHHVESAKRLGFKTLITFHLAGNSCITSTLMYEGANLCDGIINPVKCSNCFYNTKGITGFKKNILTSLSKNIYRFHIDTQNIGGSMGTALGFPFIVKQKKELLYRLSNACDKLVTITNWYHNILILNGISKEKTVVIPQALPSFSKSNFNRSDKRKEVGKTIKLVFIGRISQFKGLHLLIDAVKRFAPNEITLDIYGHSLKDAYAEQCLELISNAQNIEWCGSIPAGESVSVIQSYDALCLPSTFSEMSPLVIQEAFAAGKPVIASNVYGNAEQIKHNHNGLLFQINSVASLYEQLRRLIEEPTLLHNLNSNITQPNTFEVVGDAYLKLYKELLANR